MFNEDWMAMNDIFGEDIDGLYKEAGLGDFIGGAFDTAAHFVSDVATGVKKRVKKLGKHKKLLRNAAIVAGVAGAGYALHKTGLLDSHIQAVHRAATAVGRRVSSAVAGAREAVGRFAGVKKPSYLDRMLFKLGVKKPSTWQKVFYG